MRILVTTNYYFSDRPTGAARLAGDLAGALARLGHEVWFLAQAPEEDSPEYLQQSGIRLLRYHLKQTRLPDVTRIKKHSSAVKRLLAKYLPDLPDIIHGHDLLIYAAVLEFYEGRGNFRYTIHSPAIKELPIVWRSQGLYGRLKILFGLSAIRQLERSVLDSSVTLAAESRFTTQLIKECYGTKSADRITIIPGWVDLERFRPLEQVTAIRRTLEWPTDKLVFFVLRRLEARMGLHNLLHALQMLRQRGQDFFVAIGGSGSLAAPLVALRDRLGLEAHVSFVGRISDQTLPLAYAACDASIMPTTQLECFGIPVLESMACGRTVLATPIGAIPEIVSPFEPQWLARSPKSTDLADLFEAFLTGCLPIHTSQQMREYVSAKYSREIAFAHYLQWLGI